MRIHAIEGETITWRCANPTCQYHHCQGAHPDEACPHHEGKDVAGEYLRVPISHEEVQYVRRPDGSVNTDLIALPVCACGTRTFVRVSFTPEELEEPVIHRDPTTQNILSVDLPDQPQHIILKEHIQRTFVAMDQVIPQSGTIDVTFLNGIPHQQVLTRIIDDCYVAPWIAHHIKLGELMQQNGKGSGEQ